MSGPFPSDVTVTELPAGVRYRLPPRRLGAYRFVGLALFLIGLTPCVGLLVPTWKLVQAVRQQLPPEQGLLWLGGWMVCAALCTAGASLVHVGLFLFAGHSEIELRGATLSAAERCGPLRWTWERPAAGLRLFFVAGGLESLNLFGKLSAGPLGAVGAITPQWQAVAGGPPAKSMRLAPGYPRPLLVALAEDLTRRLDPATAAAVVVLEQPPDFSDYEELAEQPAGSRIAVEQLADGLRLTVPPGVGGGPGWHVGGAFLCFMAFAFFTKLFERGPERDMALGLNVLLVAATVGGGIAFIVAQANLSRRRVELAVRGEALTVRQTNLFGSREWHWGRGQLADVFVLHHPDSDGPDHWELQIQPRPGAGAALRLLAYQDAGELRWLATVLRRALRCPGDSQDSPPRGLVVRSPRLAFRGREHHRPAHPDAGGRRDG